MTAMYMCAYIYMYSKTAVRYCYGFSCVCKYTAITLIQDESLNQMRLRFRGTEDRLKMKKSSRKITLILGNISYSYHLNPPNS